MTARRASRSWLGERTGAVAAIEELSARRVGRYEVERYLGVVVGVLLLVLVASGILLAMQYRPNLREAHDSVLAIASTVAFGNLVRGVHQWSADLLVGSMIALCVALLLRRVYRRPGELVWIAALGLLAAVVMSAFTGSVLPWTSTAREQARILGGMMRSIPGAGEAISHFVLGGEEVGAATLPRAFGFHVAVLPAAITMLALAYRKLYARLSQIRAASDPDLQPYAPTGVPVYPDFVLRSATIAVGVGLVVVSLATFFPRLPDVASAEAALTPPWFLAFFHQLLRAAPPKFLGAEGPQIVGAVLTVLGLVVVLLPFLDPRGSRVTRWLGLVGFAVLAVLTVYGLQ